MTRAIQPLVREPRDDTGTTRNVEHAIAGRELHALEQQFHPRLEQRTHKGALVLLRKRQNAQWRQWHSA
ncbi:MAG TPA: hypothetical protein VMN60_12285 [Longimicrobiales bacterium]|nr:hypothetical protein [Longimicrobiales bacterium]